MHLQLDYRDVSIILVHHICFALQNIFSFCHFSVLCSSIIYILDNQPNSAPN